MVANLRCLALASSAAAALVAGKASAETHATVDVSVGATVASNPYLIAGDDRAAVGVNLTVDPRIVFEGVKTTFRLDGRASIDQFIDRYGTDEAVRLRLSSEHMVSERTSLSGAVAFNSSRSASRHRFLLGSEDPATLEPGEFPDVPVIDPTLGGLGGRSHSLDSVFALNRVLSPTSDVSVSGSAGWTWFDGAFGEEYRDASLGLRYRQRISTKTVLVGELDGGMVDYLGQRSGDSTLITGMAGVERQLTQSLALSAQLGASWVNGKTAAGDTRDSLALAASFDLCRRSPRATGCLSASRSARPTAAGGLSSVTAVGLSYSRMISDRQQFSVSASYGRSGDFRSGPVQLANRSSEVIGASASYSHQISNRLSAFVSPAFTRASNLAAGDRENYQGRVGITYRLGRLR